MNQAMSTRDFVQRILLAILLVALALALWQLRSALMLMFLSVIIASALSKPATALQKRGLSRGLSVALTVIGAFTIFALLMILIVPVFVEQVTSLVEELPSAIKSTEEGYNDFASNYAFLPKLPDTGDINQKDITDFILAQAGAASRTIFPFLSNIGGVFTNILVVVVLAIFLLAEPNVYIEGFLTLVPRGYRPRAVQVIDALGDAISLSLGAQVLAMIIVGTLTSVGLTIIGVPNALALGIIAGLLNFIPTFGPIVALIIGIIFTLASEPDKFLIVLIMYLFIQQLESNVITPRVVKRALNMPGAMVIITQIVAGILFGFLGLILAVPLVAVVMVLVRELYVRDALNSRKAEIQILSGEHGQDLVLVSNEPYRPETFSPGEAARLAAQGADPFEVAAQTHTIEIINPSERQMQRVEKGQTAVWLAILALVAAQSIAFIRSLVDTGNSRPSD